MPSTNAWRGKRVLLTGHTGFKGAWLWAWLTRLGAEVHGIALRPETSPNLSALLGIDRGPRSHLVDIRESRAVHDAVAAVGPQVIIHMAAQALVRRSYAEPVETFETNVTGTLNVLGAARALSGLDVVLVITSDKVYDNNDLGRAFTETDPLGGHDPYSASKAACEIAVQSFARSFFAKSGVALATGRAGNVIGGGDWSQDRIIPDLWRAQRSGEPVSLRYPHATRPWQHVLEPLAGYLDFAEALMCGLRQPALNFGPIAEAPVTVREIAEAFQTAYGSKTTGWTQQPGDHPKEAALLAIDATRATEVLPWRPRLTAAEAVQWTAEWFAAFDRGASASDLVAAQIDAYEGLIA